MLPILGGKFPIRNRIAEYNVANGQLPFSGKTLVAKIWK